MPEMKWPLAYFCFLSVALGQSVVAPLQWDVELSRPESVDLTILRGETVDLEPRFLSSASPITLPTNSVVRLLYRAPDMDADTYHELSGDLHESDAGRVSIRWSPAADNGASRYDYNVVVEQPTGTALVRSYGKLNMRGSVFGDAANPATITNTWTHVFDTANPHQVTAAKTGAYTQAEADALLAAKQDAATAATDAELAELTDELATKVGTTGDETIAGSKTFSSASFWDAGGNYIRLVTGRYPTLTFYDAADNVVGQLASDPSDGDVIYDYNGATGGSFKVRNSIGGPLSDFEVLEDGKAYFRHGLRGTSAGLELLKNDGTTLVTIGEDGAAAVQVTGSLDVSGPLTVEGSGVVKTTPSGNQTISVPSDADFGASLRLDGRGAFMSLDRVDDATEGQSDAVFEFRRQEVGGSMTSLWQAGIRRDPQSPEKDA